MQFGDGSAGGSNSLGGKLDVTGGTLAIQTPATLNVAQSVTFADNTALSIIAKPNGPSPVSYTHLDVYKRQGFIVEQWDQSQDRIFQRRLVDHLLSLIHI